jgi:hypothetical protein
MRPFLPWPHNLLAPLAIFVAMMYGMSLNASAYQDYHLSLATPSEIRAFVRNLFSPKFAEAQESGKKRGLVSPTPRLPIRTPTPIVSPKQTPKATPTITPEPSPSPTPEAVAVVTPEPTPTPVPSSDQVAINFEPAKRLIQDAVLSVIQPVGKEAFNLGKLGVAYNYDSSKLSMDATRKMYAVAAVGLLVGCGMLIRYSRFKSLS